MFSLRSLFWFVTVLSIWLAGWSYSARAQQSQVERIRQLGGEVEYKSLWPLWMERSFGQDFTCRVQCVRFFHFGLHAGTSSTHRFVQDEDLETVLGLLAKLPHLEEVVLLSHNHGNYVSRLRANFPFVQIQLIRTGVI